MLIVCPSCATAFRVTKDVLGDSGRQVRCAQCRTIWLATADQAVEEPAIAEAAGAGGPQSPPPAPDPGADDADWGAAFAEEAREKGAPGAEGAPADDLDAIPAAESPSLQPDANVAPLPARSDDAGGPDETASSARQDVESAVVKRRKRPVVARSPRKPFQMSLPVAILLACTAIMATFLLGREQVVRTMPDTAAIFERLGLPVNLRGVEFRDVKGANEIVDGVVVLVVEGRLVNITGRPIELPRLRLAVRDASGKEIYTWTATAPKAQLDAGEAIPFRSRLASPPPDGASVEVRFFSRVDAAGR
jgi:predicted Zn finger-like uncharacterized protein